MIMIIMRRIYLIKIFKNKSEQKKTAICSKYENIFSGSKGEGGVGESVEEG